MNKIDKDPVHIFTQEEKNIKKYRQEKNMTQAELAEKADLSHDYIRQIESEKIANTFFVQTVYDTSKALDISIELLFKIE